MKVYIISASRFEQLRRAQLRLYGTKTTPPPAERRNADKTAPMTSNARLEVANQIRVQLDNAVEVEVPE